METLVAERPVVAEKSLLTCPACKNMCQGPLCNNCGEDVHPQRIATKTLLSSIPDVFFDLESGLFYTIKTFFKRPGAEVKEYFAGDRSRHIKPLKFILITAGLYALIFLNFEITSAKKMTPAEEFSNDMTSVIMLFQFPFITLFTWFFFKSRQYNFGEHLVANAFIIGEVILFNIALFPIYYFVNHTGYVEWIHGIYLFILIPCYYTYAYYGWFYNKKTSRGLLITSVFVFGLLVSTLIYTVAIEYILLALGEKYEWYEKSN